MTATRTRSLTFRKGWEHPVSPTRDQLTHAVPADSTISACGIKLTVFGEAWALPPRSHPQSRCAICSQSVALSAQADRID